MTGPENETLIAALKELRALNQRFDRLELSIKPAMDFYQRVLGALAIARWLGPLGVIGALAGVVYVLMPK